MLRQDVLDVWLRAGGCKQRDTASVCLTKRGFTGRTFGAVAPGINGQHWAGTRAGRWTRPRDSAAGPAGLSS